MLAAAILVLAILPLGRLVVAAFAPGWSFDAGPALAALTTRAAVLATWHSLETSLGSAAIAFSLGLAAALLLALSDVRGKRPIALLFVLTLMIAPQVTALAFLTLAGPSSPLLNTLGLAPPPGSPNPLIGREGVIFVLGLHHAPLVWVVLMAGLKRLPNTFVEAAAVEGASSGLILRRIVLPMIRPHLVGAALLAFVAGIGNFGIPALLGIPANYLTLPTLIYRRLSSFGPAIIGDAAALSILVAGLAALGIGLAGWALGVTRVPLEADRPIEPFWRLGRARPLAEAALWGLIGLGLILPLLALATAALVPTYGIGLTAATVTLDNFVEVLARQAVTIRAFRNSFLFAAGAGALLAALAIPLAWALERRAGRARRVIEALIELPYALPGIVLAIACILLFLKPLPLVGVSLYATPWIILFAYVARFLAVALKPALAAMAQLDHALEEAAALDGASLAQRLRHVIVPTLLPAATAGGLLVFLIAFNELTVSALLWASGTETLGVVLFSLEEAGLVSQAAAVAVATIAIIVALMLALDLMARRLPPGLLPWRL